MHHFVTSMNLRINKRSCSVAGLLDNKVGRTQARGRDPKAAFIAALSLTCMLTPFASANLIAQATRAPASRSAPAIDESITATYTDAAWDASALDSFSADVFDAASYPFYAPTSSAPLSIISGAPGSPGLGTLTAQANPVAIFANAAPPPTRIAPLAARSLASPGTGPLGVSPSDSSQALSALVIQPSSSRFVLDSDVPLDAGSQSSSDAGTVGDAGLAAVPEPGSLGLLLLGAIALAAKGRRAITGRR